MTGVIETFQNVVDYYKKWFHSSYVAVHDCYKILLYLVELDACSHYNQLYWHDIEYKDESERFGRSIGGFSPAEYGRAYQLIYKSPGEWNTDIMFNFVRGNAGRMAYLTQLWVQGKIPIIKNELLLEDIRGHDVDGTR